MRRREVQSAVGARQRSSLRASRLDVAAVPKTEEQMGFETIRTDGFAMTKVSVERFPLARILSAIILFGLTLNWSACGWAQGPENTLVVVNRDSPSSMEIANHYIALRKIPVTNVLYLDQPTNYREQIDAETSHTKYFQLEFLKPILAHMNQKGITKQITCVTYSAGFPTRFNCQAPLIKYLETSGAAKNPKLQNPYASLTSLTYFNEGVFSAKPVFIDPKANRYAWADLADPVANPFVGVAGTDFDDAEQLFEEGQHKEAREIYQDLAEKHPRQAMLWFLIAKCFAEEKQVDPALEALEQASQLGWSYPKMITSERSLRSLKQKPRFRRLVRAMVKRPARALPARAFTAGSYWAENGWASSSSGQGKRYLLSTVLAVTGPRASTTAEAVAQIESSVAADGTFPRGKIYIASHKDVRCTCRQQDLALAAAELKLYGLNPEVSKQPWPKGNQKVAGATLGSGKVEWIRDQNRFLPGALCDNLTSYGAYWTKSGQTQFTEFLKAGAAGASGTVVEPYAVPYKFPNSRLHVNYAQGSNLAEAFYQSVTGPFQLLIAGDPLCRPYAKFPRFEISGIEENDQVDGDFELAVEVEKDSPSIGHFEVFLDGRFWTQLPSRKFLVTTGGMTEGYHEIRIVAVSNTATAPRTSQSLGFILQTQEKPYTLLKAASTRLRRGERIALTTQPADDFDVLQNGNVVGKIVGGTGSLPSARVGEGPVFLQAVKSDGTRASIPLRLEITEQ